MIPLQFAPHQSYFIVFRSRATRHLPVSSTPQVNFPKLVDVAPLTGLWQVQFDPKWGGPKQPVTFAQLEDWTKNAASGIKYFSGTAIYRKTFDTPTSVLRGKLVLVLGITHNDLCRVTLNGKDLGVVWTAPFQVALPKDLLKATDNALTVEVTNTWANRLIGDEQEPPDCEWLPGYMGHGCFLKRFPDWFMKKQSRPSRGATALRRGIISPRPRRWYPRVWKGRLCLKQSRCPDFCPPPLYSP